jgi:hypothetical protein
VCERDGVRGGWVPAEVPGNPFQDFTWWDDGVNGPTSGLQVEQPRRPTLVVADRHGRPVPRRVHRVGFQAAMVDEMT